MAVGTIVRREGSFGIRNSLAIRTAAIIFVVKIIVVDWKRNCKRYDEIFKENINTKGLLFMAV